jgi:hypothetical protein
MEAVHSLLHRDEALCSTRSLGGCAGFVWSLEDSLFENFILNFDGAAIILWVTLVSPDFPRMLDAANLLFLEIVVHVTSGLRSGLAHRNYRGLGTEAYLLLQEIL